jgi:hypothetical protein
MIVDLIQGQRIGANIYNPANFYKFKKYLNCKYVITMTCLFVKMLCYKKEIKKKTPPQLAKCCASPKPGKGGGLT